MSRSEAPFENEISDELFARSGQNNLFGAAAFRVPPQVLATQKRDLTAASASGGGYLVDTQVLSVFDALRPRMVTGRLGALLLPGLKSSATVARQGATVSVTWQAHEAMQAVETSTLSLSSIALAAKTVCAYVEESRLLATMAPEFAEALMRNDLTRSLASAVDAAALNGSGASGEPLGLLNTVGIGTFTGASVSYAGVLEAQTDILSANALSDELPGGGDGEVAFACRPAVASLLANRQGFSTTAPMWVGPLARGQLIGCPAISSMQIPAATLVAGDFSNLLIAEWAGGLEIRVNPYANFQAGIRGFGAFLTVDVAVLAPLAFSVATGVT